MEVSTLSEQAPDSALVLVWEPVEVSGPTFFFYLHCPLPPSRQGHTQGWLPANAGEPLEPEPPPQGRPVGPGSPWSNSEVSQSGLNWSDFVTAFSLFTRCGLFRLIPSFHSKLDNSLLSAFPASEAG